MIFLPFIIEVILLRYGDFLLQKYGTFFRKTLKTDFISTQIRGEKKIEEGGRGG